MSPTHLPIYLASLGPANLRLTGEIADGWIGTSFFRRPRRCSSTPSPRGAKTAGRELADLDLTVAVGVEFTDDVEAAGRRHAEGYTFTIGAMGSAGTNFYNNAFERQGYGDDVPRGPTALARRRQRRRPTTSPPPSGSARTSSAPTTSSATACACTATPPASPPAAPTSTAAPTPISTASSATSNDCST